MRDVKASIAELRAIWGQGAGLHKRLSDLQRYDVLIERIQPEVIVETGLYYGGSQLHFAKRVPYHIAVELPDDARDEHNQTTHDYRVNKHGLGWPPDNGFIVEGHSLHVYDEVAELAHKLAGDKPILVVLDSDHGTEHVYGEMVLYSQLVTPSSYMVVEDGILAFLPQVGTDHYEGPETPNNWFEGNPLEAIERYLESHDDFEVDIELEDLFPTTASPMGWLRRLAVV